MVIPEVIDNRRGFIIRQQTLIDLTDHEILIKII